MSIFVATDACKGCGACLATCPERALRPAPGGWLLRGEAPLVTLADRCTGCGECMEICPADAFVEQGGMSHAVHPIEAESYRILRARVDLSHLPALTRAVTERVVHASADLEYAETLIADEEALRAGRAALLGGAPLVCDTRMVAGGITRREATVPLLDPRAAELAASRGHHAHRGGDAPGRRRDRRRARSGSSATRRPRCSSCSSAPRASRR